MSLQVCLHCRQCGCTWYLDDKLGPLTQWRCSLCEYIAQEDETLESTRPFCGCERMRRASQTSAANIGSVLVVCRRSPLKVPTLDIALHRTGIGVLPFYIQHA